jgi:hypothetical protein
LFPVSSNDPFAARATNALTELMDDLRDTEQLY